MQYGLRTLLQILTACAIFCGIARAIAFYPERFFVPLVVSVSTVAYLAAICVITYAIELWGGMWGDGGMKANPYEAPRETTEAPRETTFDQPRRRKRPMLRALVYSLFALLPACCLLLFACAAALEESQRWARFFGQGFLLSAAALLVVLLAIPVAVLVGK